MKKRKKAGLSREKKLVIGGVDVASGSIKDIELKFSESYFGTAETLFVRAYRAEKPGPRVFVTGAVHGDELTGVGVIRELMLKKLNLLKGALICVPIVNIFGFENHSRYLPDRRDLNRSFPGNDGSTMADRLAHVVYHEVIKKCDYGIDLHSAAVRRTNFPQIRGNLKNEKVAKIAHAFGCELIVQNKGPSDSLRSAATAGGCPTILYEAGETLKFEPGPIRLGIRGVMNVLKVLGMIEGTPIKPAYQTIIKKTVWERSDKGGLLKFYVKPGDLVKKGQRLVTCHKLFSKEYEPITASVDGVVLGMTTLPAVKPGEPICHIAITETPLSQIAKKLQESSLTLHRQIEQDLATSFKVEPRVTKKVKKKQTKKA